MFSLGQFIDRRHCSGDKFVRPSSSPGDCLEQRKSDAGRRGVACEDHLHLSQSSAHAWISIDSLRCPKITETGWWSRRDLNPDESPESLRFFGIKCVPKRLFRCSLPHVGQKSGSRPRFFDRPTEMQSKRSAHDRPGCLICLSRPPAHQSATKNPKDSKISYRTGDGCQPSPNELAAQKRHSRRPPKRIVLVLSELRR
jgi:hypothetical protein